MNHRKPVLMLCYWFAIYNEVYLSCVLNSPCILYVSLHIIHLSTTLTVQSLRRMDPCCQLVGLLLVVVWYNQRPGQQSALVEQS